MFTEQNDYNSGKGRDPQLEIWASSRHDKVKWVRAKGHTFFFFFNKFIYLFLAALGLRCCAQAFSSCGERGLLFVVVCRLLIAVASLVAEHGL